MPVRVAHVFCAQYIKGEPYTSLEAAADVVHLAENGWHHKHHLCDTVR